MELMKNHIVDVSEEFAKFETGVEKVDKDIMYILENIPWVDIKPYSHNIISCSLRHLSKIGHNEIALDIIERTPLMDLGWGHWVRKERNKNRTELVSMEQIEKLTPEKLEKILATEEFEKKRLSLM
jgi:hypothetical protein